MVLIIGVANVRDGIIEIHVLGSNIGIGVNDEDIETNKGQEAQTENNQSKTKKQAPK